MKRLVFFGLIGFATLISMVKEQYQAQATGLPVVDVANLTQNILITIRTLQSNINEAQQIANQMQSIENEFRNLESLEYSVIDEYRKRFEDLFETLGRVQGLMQDYSTLEEEFEEAYPNWNRSSENLPSEMIADKARQWLDRSRESILGATMTGARVLEKLPKTQGELEKLLESSQGSVGILQATQAGNQIAAQVAGSITALNAQMATYSQAHLAYLVQVQQEEAANRNRMDHVLDSVYQEKLKD